MKQDAARKGASHRILKAFQAGKIVSSYGSTGLHFNSDSAPCLLKHEVDFDLIFVSIVAKGDWAFCLTGELGQFGKHKAFKQESQLVAIVLNGADRSLRRSADQA